MPAKTYELTERTMLDKDGKAQPASVGGVTLLGVAGKRIPMADAIKYGLVEGTDPDTYPKHTGGGWYQLSSGEKVKGKDPAQAAEKQLLDAPPEDKALGPKEDK